jgi:hypothetical protein
VTYALHVDKVNPNGTVDVRHTFYGDSEKDCERKRDQHGEGCRAFGPALEAGTVAQHFEEIADSERPEYEDKGNVIDV